MTRTETYCSQMILMLIPTDGNPLIPDPEAGLKSALIYEFNNYECGYTMSPEEAVEALGFTMQDTKDESQLIGMVFDAVWSEYLNECE